MEQSYEQIRDNFLKVKSELEKARLAKIPSVIEKIKQMMEEFQITPEDLGFTLAAKPRGSRSAKKAVQKYAQPENPELTWSGAGRKPQWVKDHLDNGGQLEDLRIKSTDSATSV